MKDDAVEMRLERIVREFYSDEVLAKVLNNFFEAISEVGMPEKTIVTAYGRFYVENGKPGTYDKAQRKESQAFQVLVATVKQFLEKPSDPKRMKLLQMLVEGM